MGSLEDAMCIGFICRLCSRPKRSVIFIFGVRGRQLDLLNKINSYLPIQVRQDDDLPKTICEACLAKILQHHQLIERIQQVQKRFLMMRNESNTPHINTDDQRTDAVPASESAHSSRTLSVDSTEPVEEPAQEPKASTSNTQLNSATNAETRPVSPGLQNEQTTTMTDSATTSKPISDANALEHTGPVRKKRRNFRVVKIVRKRLKRTPENSA
uniref:ZAD domain-containing protein n=1 Tax=Anopheles atroparvus TaxID=41427 RepID=A0AAG5CTU5_ANOAO